MLELVQPPLVAFVGTEWPTKGHTPLFCLGAGVNLYVIN